MKTLFAAIALLLTTSSGVSAIELEYLRNIKSIEVALDKLTDDECWTELTETKKYAEEELRSLGATIYDGGDRIYGEHYLLYVGSQAISENGLCWGSVDISLITGSIINDEFHWAAYKQRIFSHIDYENINDYVWELIREFLTPYEH